MFRTQNLIAEKDLLNNIERQEGTIKTNITNALETINAVFLSFCLVFVIATNLFLTLRMIYLIL